MSKESERLEKTMENDISRSYDGPTGEQLKPPRWAVPDLSDEEYENFIHETGKKSQEVGDDSTNQT